MGRVSMGIGALVVAVTSIASAAMAADLGGDEATGQVASVPANLTARASGREADVAEVAVPDIPGIDIESGLARVGGNRRRIWR